MISLKHFEMLLHDPKITRSHMDENEMNNIACFVLTALPRVQAFFKVLNERWEAKTFAFFFFPFRYLLCLALLDNSA